MQESGVGMYFVDCIMFPSNSDVSHVRVSLHMNFLVLFSSTCYHLVCIVLLDIFTVYTYAVFAFLLKNSFPYS